MHNLMFTKALTHCEFFCFATELKKKGREKAHMLFLKEMNKKERAEKSCGWGSCWSAIEYFRSMCVVVVALKRKLVSNCIVFFLPLQLLRRVHTLFFFLFCSCAWIFFYIDCFIVSVRCFFSCRASHWCWTQNIFCAW